MARKIQAISDFQSTTYNGDPSQWHATTIEGIRKILQLRWTVNDLTFVSLIQSFKGTNIGITDKLTEEFNELNCSEDPEQMINWESKLGGIERHLLTAKAVEGGSAIQAATELQLSSSAHRRTLWRLQTSPQRA